MEAQWQISSKNPRSEGIHGIGIVGKGLDIKICLLEVSGLTQESLAVQTSRLCGTRSTWNQIIPQRATLIQVAGWKPHLRMTSTEQERYTTRRQVDTMWEFTQNMIGKRLGSIVHTVHYSVMVHSYRQCGNYTATAGIE